MEEDTKVVKWSHVNHFEERRMRFGDWQRFGASLPIVDEETDAEAGERIRSVLLPANDTVWNADNNWTVARSEIPLTDEQLQEFFSSEQKFYLDDAPATPDAAPESEEQVEASDPIVTVNPDSPRKTGDE